MVSTSSIFKKLKVESSTINWESLLLDIVSTFGCSTGTLHFYNSDANVLILQAQLGIPEFLMPKMRIIPLGKGMAGIAAERKQAVEMYNLQTDDSGVARPAAKETKVEGSIAVPMLLYGELHGVLGIAKPVPYDFTIEERNALLLLGKEISSHISKLLEK